MKIRLGVFFICLLFFANLHAQEFIQGKILLDNGDQLEGQLDQNFDNQTEDIIFLASNSSTSRTIQTSHIVKIILRSPVDEKIQLVKMPVYGAFNKITGSLWLQELIDGDVSLYADPKNGYVHFRNETFYKLDSDVTFYLSRKSKKAVTLAGVYYTSAFNVNADNTFRKLTANYFNDCSDLVDRIQDQEFGIIEIGTVVRLYNDCHGVEESIP